MTSTAGLACVRLPILSSECSEGSNDRARKPAHKPALTSLPTPGIKKPLCSASTRTLPPRGLGPIRAACPSSSTLRPRHHAKNNSPPRTWPACATLCAPRSNSCPSLPQRPPPGHARQRGHSAHSLTRAGMMFKYWPVQRCMHRPPCSSRLKAWSCAPTKAGAHFLAGAAVFCCALAPPPPFFFSS